MQHDPSSGTESAAPAILTLARPYRVRLLDAAPASLPAQTLLCVQHGGAPLAGDDARRVRIDTPVLAGHGVELWESPLPIRAGHDDGIAYTENGVVLFGQLHLADAELANLDTASHAVYARLGRFLQCSGFVHMLRIWNFLSDITGGSGDAERYRQFALGRHRALSLNAGFERELPAATAIGTRGDGLRIWFIAGKAPGVQIENPRQVSAFQYPRQYGPRSPSFSRARLLRWHDGDELLVSGTASIVGHETVHAGSPLAQFDEALANVDALLAGAAPDAELRPELVKLYLRHPADLPGVQAKLAMRYGAAVPTLILHGDICRAALDVEIEAVFRDAR